MKDIRIQTRQYRFVGKTGYATRWRVIGVNGLFPSKRAKAKLGEGYNLQLRGPRSCEIASAHGAFHEDH